MAVMNIRATATVLRVRNGHKAEQRSRKAKLQVCCDILNVSFSLYTTPSLFLCLGVWPFGWSSLCVLVGLKNTSYKIQEEQHGEEKKRRTNATTSSFHTWL